MSTYNYFIETNCPFVFRYKHSNPDKIRTINILEYKEDKNLIIGREVDTLLIKSFKTDGIHFETEDLLPPKYESVFSEDEEEDEADKCNNNKEEFLTYAIDNDKTVAFRHGVNTYIMAPYKICGETILFYWEEHDTFKTFNINDITFVPIPENFDLTDTEEVSSDDDIFNLESDYEGDDLDISAIEEINEWY